MYISAQTADLLLSEKPSNFISEVPSAKGWCYLSLPNERIYFCHDLAIYSKTFSFQRSFLKQISLNNNFSITMAGAVMSTPSVMLLIADIIFLFSLFSWLVFGLSFSDGVCAFGPGCHLITVLVHLVLLNSRKQFSARSA